MPFIALFFNLLELFLSCENFSQLSLIINFIVIMSLVDDDDDDDGDDDVDDDGILDSRYALIYMLVMIYLYVPLAGM